MLDVRDLDDLEIDEASRTAWAGSGLTAAEYTIAAAEHGLATGFGDTGSVGHRRDHDSAAASATSCASTG